MPLRHVASAPDIVLPLCEAKIMCCRTIESSQVLPLYDAVM